jgi:hypothetical protein
MKVDDHHRHPSLRLHQPNHPCSLRTPHGMPPTSYPFDPEWGESLIGLRMSVPLSWWPGYSGNDIASGKIAKFDPSASPPFFLEVDDEPGDLYGIRYDAMLAYATVEHPTFSNYRLPEKAPKDPSLENSVAVRRRGRARVRNRGRKRRRRTAGAVSNNNDDDNGDSGDDDNDNNKDNDDNDNNDDDDDSDDEEVVVVEKTEGKDWKQFNDGSRATRRTIDPIPYTPRDGDGEFFDVKILEDDLSSLYDENGDLRYYKVHAWSLPRFGQETYWEWVAARMRNYMMHIVLHEGYKPRFYKPKIDHVILADHVARFFGCQHARMMRGHPSIEHAWSSRESLYHIGACAESMPINAFQDMHRCLHFADDWEEDADVDWENVYLDEKVPAPAAAKHRKKFGMVEDAFNARWKELVTYGLHITFDESRVAGWYKSSITIGPEPKPIRTGATLHSMCVTFGPLASFKLHVRVYGGREDEDMNKQNLNVAGSGNQKFINLLETFFADFMGRGHMATMDSAYMGELAALVGRQVWKLNMVGTSQCNRTGAGDEVKAQRNKMKVGTYECSFFQHKTLPLLVALWADNNIVTTLSNYHSPEICAEGSGVSRRRKVNKKREREKTEVRCPRQNRDYSAQFHWIDKGNGKEALFDLKGSSKLHNWSPKLVFRLMNMHNSNAYMLYRRLHELHTPDRRLLDKKATMAELTHVLCQHGEPIRQKQPEHPPYLSNVQAGIFAEGLGRKVKSTAHGNIPTQQSKTACLGPGLAAMLQTKKKYPWRQHQSLAHCKEGRCSWEKCPNLTLSTGKRKRGYGTFMRCEECSITKGKDVYFCNGIKGKKEGGAREWNTCQCHIEYHTKYHRNDERSSK